MDGNQAEWLLLVVTGMVAGGPVKLAKRVHVPTYSCCTEMVDYPPLWFPQPVGASSCLPIRLGSL